MERVSRLAPPRFPLRLVRKRSVSLVEDGILTGVMGAAVVAVWFFILDTAQGRLLFTPSLLGSVVFLGQRPEQPVSISGFVVFAYTGLHLLLFLIAGMFLAWMFSLFEHYPHFGIIVLLLFCLCETILFTFAAVIFPSLMGVLGSLAVASGNLFAAVAMFWFLMRRHPTAITRLRLAWQEE